MIAVNDKLLHILVQESLGLLIVSRRLALRCRSNNPSGALGDLLSSLAAELEDERAELEVTMRAAGVRPHRLKNLTLVTSEYLARLKLNGSLLSYSDLSRVYELHGLCLLTQHRVWLWRSLAALPTARGQAERMEARAAHQLGDLEAHRTEALGRIVGAP
jgi:hypothetical protein